MKRKLSSAFIFSMIFGAVFAFADEVYPEDVITEPEGPPVLAIVLVLGIVVLASTIVIAILRKKRK